MSANLTGSAFEVNRKDDSQDRQPVPVVQECVDSLPDLARLDPIFAQEFLLEMQSLNARNRALERVFGERR